MAKVFVLHHVHEADETEEVKLIGVYSSQDSAEAAMARVSAQPGFVDFPNGFQISPHELDKDHWTEGFIRVVSVEIPLRDSEDTVTAQATLLASGNYELWPEPDSSTERWLFKPNQIVRCELQSLSDGDRLIAMEVVSG